MQQQPVPQDTSQPMAQNTPQPMAQIVRIILFIIVVIITVISLILFLEGSVGSAVLLVIFNAIIVAFNFYNHLIPAGTLNKFEAAIKKVRLYKKKDIFSIIFLRNSDNSLYQQFRNILLEKGYNVRMKAWNGHDNLDDVIKKERRKAQHVLSIITRNFLDEAKDAPGFHDFKRRNSSGGLRSFFNKHNELLCVDEEALELLENMSGNFKINTVDLTRMTQETMVEAFVSHISGAVTSADKKSIYIGNEAKKNFKFTSYNLDYFTGRVEILRQLQIAPEADKKFMVLSGLKSIGKTQIAMMHAKNMRGGYDYIFLLRMSSTETYAEDLRNIDTLLELSNIPDNVPSPALQSFISEPTLSQKFVDWLERSTQRWLLIVDDCNDAGYISTFRAIDSNGHILLTTDLTVNGHFIKVLPLTQEEGAFLLLRRTEMLDKHQPLRNAPAALLHDALEVSQAFGNLPEALEVASLHLNYIYGRNGVPVTTNDQRLRLYLEDYGRNRHALQKIYEKLPQENGKKGVVYAWYLFFQQFQKAVPEAGEMLLMCSLLGQSPIPFAIIKHAFQLITVYQSLSSDEINLALGELLRLSLLERENNLLIMNVHIQDYLNGSEDMERAKLASYVVRATGLAFPDATSINEIQHCKEYEPHIKACEALIQEFSLEAEEIAQLYDRYGCYLREMARYQEAEEYLQKGLDLYKKLLSEQSVQVAMSISNLAELYYIQNKLDEAKELYLNSLQMYTSLTNANPLEIALVSRNLAIVYEALQHEQEALQHEQEAKKLYDAALSIWEPLLAAGNIPTSFAHVTLLKRMAYTYYRLENYDMADKMYKDALVMCEEEEEKRASSFLETDICRANLARFYFDRKVKEKYEVVELYYLWTLKLYRKIFEENHPLVADMCCNLADLHNQLFFEFRSRRIHKYYEVQEHYNEAVSYYETALTIYNQKLPASRSKTHAQNMLRELHKNPAYQKEWERKQRKMNRKRRM